MREHGLTQSIDYLMIGHLTADQTATGKRLGGTATFSALTAQALGLRVGVVTSWANDLDLGKLGEIPICNNLAEFSTTFENIYTHNGRTQRVYHVANPLEYYQIPEAWRSAPIVHLGPVAQEVDPSIVRKFSTSMIGITPQGWVRAWDKHGNVGLGEWPEARFVLEKSSAAVLSIHDLHGDEDRIEEMVNYCQVLVVTEGQAGCRVYWNGDIRRFRPPEVNEIDPTGAGDIFAAAFFVRLYSTRDPWEAARFATQLAAFSVTKPGLDGIPTPEDINKSMAEIL